MTRRNRLTRRAALRTGAAATGLLGLGVGVGTAQTDGSDSDENCYYQVDFVAGDPIETLGASEDAFYGRQNRLIQYAHGDGEEVLRRDTWLNSLDPEVRRCVAAEPIRIAGDAVLVRFRVDEGCDPRRFSLAVYPLPGGAFSFGDRQELLAATTDTCGPGTHELTVEDVVGSVCPEPPNGYEQLAKPTSDDAAEDDQFGGSVAVSDSGDTIVVGASGGFTGFGSAYVFGRADDGWTQRAELTADDATTNDRFGRSVVVSGSGDTIVVGASGSTNYVGGAYVFDRTADGWIQQAKLAADDATESSRFGALAVSDSGDTVVVGDSADYEIAGAAYVFDRAADGWTQQAKLVADDAAGDDYYQDSFNTFGASVAVSDSGDTAVVGDPADINDLGAAYVFDRTADGWTRRAKLTGDERQDPEDFNYFGASVAVSGSGDTVVVGADGSDRAAGGVYMFDRTDDGWTRRAKFRGRWVYYGLGSSVAVSDSGDTAIAGAYLNIRQESRPVHVFGRTDGGWTQQAKLTVDDTAAARSWLGRSVALSGVGDTAVISAFHSGGPSEDVKSVYVFGR